MCFIYFTSCGRADKCPQARLIAKASGGIFFILCFTRHLCRVFINIHTHRPDFTNDVLNVENVYFGQTTIPASPRQSVGIHPWHIQPEEMEQARAWLHSMATRPETIALGEAGLDKAIERALEIQIPAFEICVETSEALQKPMIIHCVRAYGEIIALKKAWKPVQPWIFHGFDKHPQTAAMLLKEGCFLSFGVALLRPDSHAAASLRITPPDRFFLETDFAEIEIKDVYRQAVRLRETSPEALENQLECNWAEVFGDLS